MERAKLKNIVLTILVITNILLLGLMITQRVASRHYRQQILLDAVELLGQQGIAARAEDMPDRDFPAPQIVEEDAQAELAAFSAVLGQDTVYAQRGLMSLYTGSMGSAEALGDGTFTLKLAPGAYSLDGQELSQHALAVLGLMGFSGQVTAIQENTVTVVEVLRNVPIFSCTVTLHYEEGQLRSIEGARLPGTPAKDPQAQPSLSTPTLLVRFRSGIINSGDACTAIRSATQGYILITDVNRGRRLIPVLRLETDANLYILNALTGELQRA